MSAQPSFIRRFFRGIWLTLNAVRKIILNLVFFGVLILIFASLSGDDVLELDNNTALVLKLNGSIVDQKRYVDPISALLQEGNQDNAQHEYLLSDLIYAIDSAANDGRISMLVMDLSGLSRTGMSQLQTVGDAVKRFKAQGKSVSVIGNYFSQQQYFLASYADEIVLNPQGVVEIQGLSMYRLFYNSALDKLKVQTHVFRVGTYKSAIEPFIRDDMSVAAKEANQSLLNNLWQTYSEIVAGNRNINASRLALSADEYLQQLNANEGDSAKMALSLGWVDSLMTLDQFRQQVIAKVGLATNSDTHTFKQINIEDYHDLVKPLELPTSQANVAIIVAEGQIMNGNQQPGDIGGESTAKLIRKAKYDDQVKALVLRVNSPGGSAFASEQIRQELLSFQATGKPVVVSMGTYAASGGYWISADADYIYATPTTITGSIGIFGLITTFQDSLASIGIYTDGVSTNDWAGLSVTRSLSPQVAAVIQRSIEKGYHEFLSIVAEGRDMGLEQVDAIAQGRVWTGSEAIKLGLVDELGDMEDAIAKAAKLADLAEYDTTLIEQSLSTEQLMIQELFGSAKSWLPPIKGQASLVTSVTGPINQALQQLSQFDDPQGKYLLCEVCRIE
ncbi:signal peptide peptidase SppA [Shewanella sp. NIFS-20-20]|uniref:signal peptide peptidase SppA n=1 Tax=Shewanella sp. NIFS-20-20 TaxID=2853806 RepID=UPI001C44D75A|nr:signal peptide peptidase SppA [Shewanella sp. NIFS-20-20]MBV7315223.1 signal peptide peptidase SppA [Shewanella sp. NIFS-20-20]